MSDLFDFSQFSIALEVTRAGCTKDDVTALSELTTSQTGLLCPAEGALSDDARLTSVCLTSVAYIGPKSRTERPRKTKIGTEVAYVTPDSDTTFKVKRSKVKITASRTAC